MDVDPADLQKSQPSSKTTDHAAAPKREPFEMGLFVYLLLALIAFFTPHFVGFFLGLSWAALIGVLVCVTWLNVMPSTCMSGGLICSLVGLAILANTAGIGCAAIAQLAGR